MSRRPLIEYEIVGEGVHCTIDIFVNNEYSCTLDTGTKYADRAEEDLAQLVKKMIKNALDTMDETYLSLCEREEE